MTTNQLHSKRCLQIQRQHHLAPATLNILFVGFLGTVVHTFFQQFFGEVWIHLTYANIDVTVGSLMWYVGINLYLALFWRVLYLIYDDVVFNWMFACYLFAIVEMFIVWDRPWFTIMGIAFGSNLLIACGFIYSFLRWKLQNS